MLSKTWRAGLLTGVLGLLAAARAGAQPPEPRPPGVPPSESRAGQPAPRPAEVPATGCPMTCVPEIETKKRDKRVYSSACFNMCYPKCCHGGCGACGDPCETPCDAEGCHKCGHVYTHKYLVLHLRPEEYCVTTCKPVPAPCEEACPKPHLFWRLFSRHAEPCAEPCPPAPDEMPAPGGYVAPGTPAVPTMPSPYLAVPPGR